MGDAKTERAKLLEIAQAFADQAASYLLETVPDGEHWEDAGDDVDAARTIVMDMIDSLEVSQAIEAAGVTNG